MSFIPKAMYGLSGEVFGKPENALQAVVGPIGSRVLGLKKDKPSGPTQDQLAPLSGQPRYGRGSSSLSV